MNKKDLKEVKKWAIGEMECNLRSFTYPQIKKVSRKNFEEAIKQQEKGSPELEDLKIDYEIFKIIEKW